MVRKITITELKIQLADGKFTGDEIGIEKRFVEAYRCDACGRNLRYEGYANQSQARSYGICDACATAREFYFSSPAVAHGKRRFSRSARR